MARATRTSVALAVSAAVLAIMAGVAHGDGLPIPGVQVKPGGVATPDGRSHFLTTSTSGKTTVRKVDAATGKTVASTTVSGSYTVPAVALDGTPGGLPEVGRAACR